MVNRTNVFNDATTGFQTDRVLEKMWSRIILQAGENSVVDNAKLPHLDADKSVLLTSDVYKTLNLIADTTNTRGVEIPFLLFGDYEDRIFVFGDIEVDVSASDNPYEVDFSHYLEQKILDFGLGAKKQENKVVVHGHSHPRVGPGYLNFSLGDMRAYFGIRKKTWLQNVMFCGCLLTGGNFNFVFCDGTDVYRIDNVFVGNENGGFVKLPSFGPDVATLGRGRTGHGR